MSRINPQKKEQEENVALIDLVEQAVRKEWAWLGKGTAVPDWAVHVVKCLDGEYEIAVSGRCAGVLVGSKWYGWTELTSTLIPTPAADPKFMDKIIEDTHKAFIRSGEDVRWNRKRPI